MCWIFAYKWNKEATSYLINGLKHLEYRWYDSAWLCELDNKWNYYIEKALGKVVELENKVNKSSKKLLNFTIWIAHTRWATHGRVMLKNTHPHKSSKDRFFVVHNWIIENYIELKKNLEKKYDFYSGTDTEIIAKLIEEYWDGNLKTTLDKVVNLLRGTYAIAVLDTENSDVLVWIKFWTPLMLGISEDGFFLSSDSNALNNVAHSLVLLDDNNMVVIQWSSYTIYEDGKKITKEVEPIIKKEAILALGDYSHYMQKEIFETPKVLANIFNSRIYFEKNKIMSTTLDKLSSYNIDRIEIIASWTSYNAGMISSFWFEELTGIPTSIYGSSEYKYKRKFINDRTLYIFISQSGETADSLECLKIVKKQGWLTFGIVNVVGSSIARLADMWIYTYCGPEIWVAATKTFMGQLAVLFMMMIHIWEKWELQRLQSIEILNWLRKLEPYLNKILKQKDYIRELARKYAKYEDFFFLGRNLLYPVAKEWSLKLKEITYRHSESYSAGELKHGPLSLVDKNFPCVLLNPKWKLYEKNISTLKEIKARNGVVLWIISKWDENKDLYDDVIEVPLSVEELYPFTVSLALQLFAYYMAEKLGRDIDKPRNLAKSVTVE